MVTDEIRNEILQSFKRFYKYVLHSEAEIAIFLVDGSNKEMDINCVDPISIHIPDAEMNDCSTFLNYISSKEKLLPILLLSSEEALFFKAYPYASDDEGKHTSLTIFLKEPYPQETPNNSDKYFEFLKCPFNLLVLKQIIESLNSKTLENPYRYLAGLLEKGKELFPSINNFANIANFYRELSIIDIEKDENEENKKRLKIFHSISSEEEKIKKRFFLECCRENIRVIKEKYCNKQPSRKNDEVVKVLWIENKPEEIKCVKEILENYFEYNVDIKSDKLDDLYNAWTTGSAEFNYELILIDIFLDSEKLNGKDFLQFFSQKYSHIPVFILSALEDLETKTKTLKAGADFFIPKKYAISIPHYYRKFDETTGKIARFFEDKNLKRNLVGNIRHWRFHQNLLWFGDKCYHMINHSYEHSANEWKLLNDLLYPKIKKEGINKNKCFGSDENLYCLCMAVWLHDIGHNGNERYGAPHEIRENHGIISGEFILKHYDLLRICPGKEGDKDKDKERIKRLKDQYKDIVFPFGPQRKSVIQLILENVKKTKILSIPEKIALLSIYHKSNSPVSRSEYKNSVNKEKIVPIDFFEGCNRKDDVITFEDIIDKLRDKEGKEDTVEKEDLEKMVYIFRFIDALDIRQNRVGSADEKEIKSKIIEQDKRYLLDKLKKELESIIQSYSGDKKIDSLSKMALMKIFYQDMQEKIMKGDSVSHLDLPELAVGLSGNLDNYFMLAKYASFISVQDGHFDFHSSIEDVEIKSINGSSIEIIYKSNKELKYLVGEKIVRDPGEKEKRSVVGRLIGTEAKDYTDGYVIHEYEGGGHILEGFVKLTKITLSCKDKGEPYPIAIQYDKKWFMDDDTKNKLRQYSGGMQDEDFVN